MIQLDDVVIGDEEGPKIVGIVFERGHVQQAISDGADLELS